MDEGLTFILGELMQSSNSNVGVRQLGAVARCLSENLATVEGVKVIAPICVAS